MEISDVSKVVSEEISCKKAWKAHVAHQNASGLSKAEYCRRHKLSYHCFGYWCRRTSVQPKKLIAVSLKSALPVKETPLCRFHFRNGCELSIHDLQTLSFVLQRMN